MQLWCASPVVYDVLRFELTNHIQTPITNMNVEANKTCDLGLEGSYGWDEQYKTADVSALKTGEEGYYSSKKRKVMSEGLKSQKVNMDGELKHLEMTMCANVIRNEREERWEKRKIDIDFQIRSQKVINEFSASKSVWSSMSLAASSLKSLGRSNGETLGAATFKSRVVEMAAKFAANELNHLNELQRTTSTVEGKRKLLRDRLVEGVLKNKTAKILTDKAATYHVPKTNLETDIETVDTMLLRFKAESVSLANKTKQTVASINAMLVRDETNQSVGFAKLDLRVAIAVQRGTESAAQATRNNDESERLRNLTAWWAEVSVTDKASFITPEICDVMEVALNPVVGEPHVSAMLLGDLMRLFLKNWSIRFALQV